VRGQDAYPLKRVERQQVLIAGYNVRGKATHGKFQKLVIVRVSTGGYFRADLNPFGLADQGGQEAASVIFVDILAELLPTQDFVEFP